MYKKKSNLHISNEVQKEKVAKMKHLIKFTLIILVVLIAGCSMANKSPRDNRVTINGSGKMVSQEVAIAGFDKVETGFAFNVLIRQDDKFSVVASVDENLAHYLHIEKMGTTLKIGLKSGYAYDIPHATMRAVVTMPELNGLNLNASSHATLIGFDSLKNLSAELDGSSSLSGKIQAETMNLKAYGSTFLKLSGTGSDLAVDACSSGIVDLGDYHVVNADIQVACASVVIVNVDGELDVDAAQNSQVHFTGNPARDLNVHENAFVGSR